jgi:hypothetical protein
MMAFMRNWLCVTNPCQRLIRASRSLLPVVAGLLPIVLHLSGTLPAAAQSYPLPPWDFYGGGNGSTWGGSSTSPDNAQLTVTLYSPPVPNQYGTAVANGSAEVLQITPVTTYALTLSAMVSGSGSAQALMVDGTGVITNISISGSTWKPYTNSFTTGTPDDQRVGRSLNVQLLLNRFSSLGTATASFTNVQFHVLTAQPTLSYRLAAHGPLQLLWPTNFYWYVPEQTTNLQTGSWEGMTNLPIVLGDQCLIQVDMEMGRCFFRLRQP